MILYVFVAFVFSTVFAQDAQFAQRNNFSDYPFGIHNLAIVDDQPQPNLWLISRDDPVPANLNPQIVSRDQISTRQTGGMPANGYGMRLSAYGNVRSSDNVAESTPSQASLVPLYYDRVLTSENRRQRFDGNVVEALNPDSILVELPIDITEGLWVRPQSQIPQQILSGRQNVESENINIKYDEVNRQRKDDTSTVYVPIRELTSRLPNVELSAQGEWNRPREQYFDLPYQTVSQNLGDSNVQNEANQVNGNGQDIWLVNNAPNTLTSEDNNLTSNLYFNPLTDPAERSRNVQEYGVLTGEDIELLERLGILSALVIEHIDPENATNNFTTFENSQREYEGEPLLIDHGGRSYFRHTDRENTSQLGDVALMDIPKFTASQYHSNLPENVGEQEHSKPTTPLTVHIPDSSKTINESSDSFIGNNLTDRQILEILQILSLNAGDFYNLSSLTPERVNSSVSEGSILNSLKNSSTSEWPERSNGSFGAPAERFQVSESPKLASAAAASTANGETLLPVSEQFSKEPPRVSNGRIQPRLLEKITKSDNEIIEGLLKRPNRVFESDLDIRKKQEIKPKPYLFGFNQDDGNGTLQHRIEKADGSGVVEGSYGYTDRSGVYRNVSYIADNNGFHAVVKSNEPGTISHNTADVVFMSETPPLAALIKMMAYRRLKNSSNATITP